MPEGPEVTILGEYLNSKTKGKTVLEITILSGKYKRKGINDIEKINKKKYKIKKVDSKGKLMWFELENDSNELFITSHLGLAGFWSFYKSNNDRIVIKIKNEKNDKEYNLYFSDPRNFGNIEIVSEDKLNNKLSLLADDALKCEFTNEEFEEKIIKYLSVSSSRKNQMIFKVLMKQEKNDGLLSGLGNYLTPEILYDCKISPKREIGLLKQEEIHRLAYSIKYIIKLSYYNNFTGYMTNFGNFIEKHKKNIDDGKIKEYHTDVKLKKTDTFQFKVYQQKKDPYGNIVEANKEINKDRTTYWVPSVQK